MFTWVDANLRKIEQKQGSQLRKAYTVWFGIKKCGPEVRSEKCVSSCNVFKLLKG